MHESDDDPSGFGKMFQGSFAMQALEDSLRGVNRFFPLPESTLGEFLSDASASVSVVPAGMTVFRARVMPADRQLDSTPFPPEEMGAPPREKRRQGRLNPLGIPCLYAASDRRTAVAEMRPWYGARLTIATLTVTERLEVVNARTGFPTDRLFTWFGYMASQPVHRQDELGYVATQYLAQALHHEGYAGVIYPSSQAGGRNYAFFDEHAASVSSVELVRVSAASYTTEPVTDPFGFDE